MAATTRREFLERTAYTAGLAGMAAALPATRSSPRPPRRRATRPACPSPRNMPIDHFVVLMMENRSFDHYFGWVGEADGVQDQTYLDPAGNSVPTRHFSTLGSGGMEYKGCGHPDPGHGWDSGRAQLRGGFLADGSGNDEFALTYFNGGELGFIHDAARAYTLYDRFFCSLLASTWPNRYYKWSAQSGGLKNNDPPVGNRGQPVGDDLRPRARARAERALLRLRPAVLGRLGSARRDLDQPDHALLRRLRGRDAAEHLVRGPAVPRRRRRRRALRRRAPARRRAPRPGLHGRRGERVRELAQLPARRAVRDLRRVGRLLRPRAAAERAGRPRERRPERELRPDGVPDPGAGGVAVRARQAEERDRLPRGPRRLRPRVDPEADRVPLRPRRPERSGWRGRATSG